MIEEKIMLLVPVTIVYGTKRKNRRALAVDLAVSLIENECPLAGGCGSDGGINVELDGEIKVQRKSK